jgi:hypothetical protein
MRAAHASGRPIVRGRRRRLRPRSRSSYITAESRGLAGRPRRGRVDLPAATAATLLHTQVATPRVLSMPVEISCKPRNGTQPPAPSSTSIAMITTSTEAAKQPPEESSSILSGGGHRNFLRSKLLSSRGTIRTGAGIPGVEDGQRRRVLLRYD